jgi:N-acetylmuramoyl-L-alanine amidase
MSNTFRTVKKNTFFSILLIVVAVATAVLFLFPSSEFSITNKKTDTHNGAFVLIIDAGHGGKDDGSVYAGVKEKNITLAIAEKIKKLAPQYDVIPQLVRDSDVFVNPPERLSIASHQNGDAYISLHVNELKGYEYVSGMQVYVSNQNTKFQKSCSLGSAVASSLSDTFKVFNKLQDRAKNIYVLGENWMPAVLVECGFITNKSDVKMLTDSAAEMEIARRILEGVVNYKNDKVNKVFAVQLPKIPDSGHSKNLIANYHVAPPKPKPRKGLKLI